MIKSTRLRSITARDVVTLEVAVGSLPFKVEIKEIVHLKNKVIIYFVIPDLEGLEWESVDLT